MRCYFDTFSQGQIDRDTVGFEVSDLVDAIDQARSAITEMTPNEDIEGRFGIEELLLMRIAPSAILYVVGSDQ